MSDNPLIFIPTYNEKENAKLLYEELIGLGIDLDILFMDDGSPDGTGQLIEEISKKDPKVKVVHRTGKLGVGSAHYEGIQWAYRNGYQKLITMDCDFTHPPKMIPEILKVDADIAVGSRYLKANSLRDWNWVRKFLTRTGHFLTRVLLGMPYDATGGFRYYRLDRIPYYAFHPITSKGYSFFFESLCILHFNGYKIKEIPIALPPRTYGHSKMSYKEVYRSVRLLFSLYMTKVFNFERLKIVKPLDFSGTSVEQAQQGWDQYWNAEKGRVGFFYDTTAAFYRKFIIKPNLNRFVRSYFSPRAQVLHAGCGSGQVDQDIRHYLQITGLDNSANALQFYNKTNTGHCNTLFGSIFNIPLKNESVEGVYSLGLMEHFSESDILLILNEFKRVIKPGGRIITFWPPRFGASVIFLKMTKWILENIFRKIQIKMHPDEITCARSKRHVTRIFERAGFRVLEYSFGARDLFTYCVIVAEKPGAPAVANATRQTLNFTNVQATPTDYPQ